MESKDEKNTLLLELLDQGNENNSSFQNENSKLIILLEEKHIMQ